jgi:hypothetical protein
MTLTNGWTQNYGYGGAIWGNGGNVIAINCTFENNSAYSGGALKDATAINCTFINNNASDYGGAIHYYNNEKGLTFVDANNYKQGEYNQVLTIKNVFSGGELDENGDIIRDERKSEEREIENGYYDLLDNGADTEHSGWYRVDRIDNHRYNDKDDDNNRNGLRLHFGSLSHGCITISNRQEGFEETQNVLNTILDNTSIITVLDRSGWKRFYSNTQRTNYGTIIVTGNSKYKKREKK